MKQYNPKKPHKWGYKVIFQAGESGFINGFELYVSKGTIFCPAGFGVTDRFLLDLQKVVQGIKITNFL